MWQALGSAVDVMHALLMAAWLLGMPLLFWHGRPALTRAYAVYATAFVVISQLSRPIFGECVFTTLARWLWNHPSGSSRVDAAPDEWFTVRLSRAVFATAPSHRVIAISSEIVSAVAALGVLWSMRRLRRAPGRRAPAPSEIGKGPLAQTSR